MTFGRKPFRRTTFGRMRHLVDTTFRRLRRLVDYENWSKIRRITSKFSRKLICTEKIKIVYIYDSHISNIFHASISISISVFRVLKALLSYDVASGSEITPCNKICKPLVVYRFTGNVMTSITTLRI